MATTKELNKVNHLLQDERAEASPSELKNSILDKQEIANGYVYGFPGTDILIASVIAFVIHQRKKYPFYRFDLTIKDDQTPIWLKITGNVEAREVELQIGL